MEFFIQSSACISPQRTFDENYFFEDCLSIPSNNTFSVISPDYKELIPPNMIRRASHVLKMGIGAGLMCLKNDDALPPDAIIVGTAMGCFEDTDKFLRSIDENQERTLTPTSFIQSTHNTVAGQIALLTKNHGYNLTYVHQNLSFEFALLDAMMLLNEKEADKVLVGAVDELIPALIELFERAGHLKKQEDNSSPIWESISNGYRAGEGSAFFTLSTSKNERSTSRLSGVRTIQSIQSTEDLNHHVHRFLTDLGLSIDDVSLLLSGANGDTKTDGPILNLSKQLNIPTAYFKHFCGEYFTSSGFALWLANKIIAKQKIPANSGLSSEIDGKIQHVLIVNHYQNKQYSLICVSLC